jgi:hypothetical protein
MEIRIDEEFKMLLPNLAAEEKAALEKSILSEGCREPLVIWDGMLIDGHNRYEICQRNEIKFNVVARRFDDKHAAMDWIDQNQLGRRNLSPDAFRLALGRRYNRTKKTKAEAGAKGGASKGQIDPCLPTAERLGKEHAVSEKTVKRAGKFAEEVESNEKYQQAIRVNVPIKKVKKEIKVAQDRQDLEEWQGRVTRQAWNKVSSVCDIQTRSCHELFKSGIKPDVVITDPPYPKEFLSMFSELAEACKDVPVVAVMSGQSYIPEVMERLCEHLKYRWTMAYMTPGGQAVQQWTAKVNTSWKPVFLFGESIEWFGDVAVSKPNDNDKRFHDWGQSESGMTDLINRLTKPGQLICDPFLGGGTTAVASIAMGRRFVGCDIDQTSVDKTKKRLEGMLCDM